MILSNIVIVWNRSGDYHKARWKAFSNRVGKKNAVYLADLGADDDIYLWKTTHIDQRHVILSTKSVEQFDLWNRAKTFITLLKEKQIKYVVLSGYGKLDYVLFIILSKLMGRKLILFAESWYKSSKWKTYLKSIFLNFFVNGFFVSGKRACNFFTKSLNIQKERIQIGYSVVDNDHFESNGNYNSNIILCVARYSEEKNLIRLIEAFKISEMYESYKLVLVGDGPQKDELVKTINCDNKVKLKSWVEYECINKCYEEAKFFILPSTFEPWGLVINEAMAAGLPVLASKQCGCVDDLMSEEFGIVFDAYSVEDMINALNNVCNWEPEKYIEQSKIGKDIIKNFSVYSWADNLLKIINKC